MYVVDYGMLERQLIEHCAPTLAGMKSASLFSYFYQGESFVRREIDEINQLLEKKGVRIEVLRWNGTSALLYVYRETLLARELRQPEAWKLLKRYGYCEQRTDYCLEQLKERLADCSCFPHEIGIFLGYPVEDVWGFIVNGGKNCKSCGMWKVYCNQGEKDRLFRKYNKCRDVYRHVFYEGRRLLQMTVCT